MPARKASGKASAPWATAQRADGASLAGRTALVTGAARRLGRATALALASEGAAVVLHYHRSADEAEDLREQLLATGAKAWTLQADLEELDGHAQVLHRARATGGRIDVLVNNASLFPPGPLASVEHGDLHRVIDVNAWAPLALARAFAEQGGESVVNLLDARVGGHDPQHGAYHLSKQLLTLITKALALELAPVVRVNAVAPGPILPPEGMDEAYLERLVSRLPLRRRGSAEDVAAAVAFLARAPFVTGQVLYVDGGDHLTRAAWSP